METDYSKREIDEFMKDLKQSAELIKTGLEDLNVKVGIQNGRVAKTEGTLKGAVMAGTVTIFLMGIIMSLVVYSFKLSQENLKNSILLEVEQLK